MRINHNISAMLGEMSINRSQRQLSSSLEKLSTGVRINRASDDAAGLAVSETLRAQVRGSKQAMRNAEEGIAMLQIAEGGAGQISDILQRMRELALQSSNDTLTTTERGYTNQEFSNLMNEMQRISTGTQYNGLTLLDGASGSFGATGSQSSVLHIGANNNGGNVSGTTDSITVSINSVTVGALGLTLSGTGASAVTGQASASAAITAIDGAIGSVSNMRAGIGAVINRLENAIDNLANNEFNMQSAESHIRDTDFAKETTNFSRAQILTQAGTAMLAQANAAPNSVIALLQ